MHIAMVKPCLTISLLLEIAFLRLKTRNQITCLLESRERENAWSKTKGKWLFVSMSSAEQVENPKCPLKRKGKRWVVSLLYCLNIFMLMNPRWQAVQIIHEWIDCLWPFNTREASALLSGKLQSPETNKHFGKIWDKKAFHIINRKRKCHQLLTYPEICQEQSVSYLDLLKRGPKNVLRNSVFLPPTGKLLVKKPEDSIFSSPQLQNSHWFRFCTGETVAACCLSSCKELMSVALSYKKRPIRINLTSKEEEPNHISLHQRSKADV